MFRYMLAHAPAHMLIHMHTHMRIPMRIRTRMHMRGGRHERKASANKGTTRPYAANFSNNMASKTRKGCVHTANKLSVLARSRGGLARPRKAEPHTAGAGRHGQGCDHAGRHWDVAELSTGPDDLTHAVRSGAEQLLSEPARGFSVLGIGGGAPPPINDM